MYSVHHFQWNNILSFIRGLGAGLVQDCSISIADTLEILQSCAKPLRDRIYIWRRISYLQRSWRPSNEKRSPVIKKKKKTLRYYSLQVADSSSPFKQSTSPSQTCVRLMHTRILGHSHWFQGQENVGGAAMIRATLLTHCGLVTPYGDMEQGQHWLR